MDLFELVRVGEVMDKCPPLISANVTVGELSNRLALGDSALSRRQGTLLVDEDNNLVGIVTRGDLLRALQRDPSGKARLLEAGSTNLVITYADESLHEAIARMIKNNIGRLPVVSREIPGHVLGYLGRSSVMLARSRHLEEEELREKSKLGDLLPVRLRRQS